MRYVPTLYHWTQEGPGGCEADETVCYRVHSCCCNVRAHTPAVCGCGIAHTAHYGRLALSARARMRSTPGLPCALRRLGPWAHVRQHTHPANARHVLHSASSIAVHSIGLLCMCAHVCAAGARISNQLNSDEEVEALRVVVATFMNATAGGCTA